MKPTDYLTSDRRGRDAHDLELEVQCDPFVAEALQGLEARFALFTLDGDTGLCTAVERIEIR